MDTLRHVAQVLNSYANLLLAALTATYVWLTWRNLKALQRASLREPELRHLEEIKCNVARPLIDWLDATAVKILNGSYPPIFVTNVSIPRVNAPIGEHTYDIQRQLDCQCLDSTVVRGGLFSHSRLRHFPDELDQFEAFLVRERTFLSDLLAFARSCADEIALLTKLPRRPAADNVSEVADAETLIEICIRDTFLGKANPEIEFNASGLGVLHVGDGYVARPIGRGPTEPTKAWVENAVTLFAHQWKQSGFRERIDNLLQEAVAVRAGLERVLFTQALPHECEYVGGKGPGVFRRMREPSISWKEISRGFTPAAALAVKTLKLGAKSIARFLVSSRQEFVRCAHWTRSRIVGDRKGLPAENKNDASLPRPRMPS